MHLDIGHKNHHEVQMRAFSQYQIIQFHWLVYFVILQEKAIILYSTCTVVTDSMLSKVIVSCCFQQVI